MTSMSTRDQAAWCFSVPAYLRGCICDRLPKETGLCVHTLSVRLWGEVTAPMSVVGNRYYLSKNHWPDVKGHGGTFRGAV